MLKIENVEVYGWEAAIRGMRNPMNSWAKSDSGPDTDGNYQVGPNDLALMKKLAAAGTDHGKFMRMITVMCDVVAPLYYWPEFDAYKVGIVENSCSKMHKIHAKEFALEDFSCEHLDWNTGLVMQMIISTLNEYRDIYNNGGELDTLDGRRIIYQPKDKQIWWQMIQLLPESYNQRRTVQLNYAVLKNMYHARKNHKLDEWKTFCRWIETLPYSELITDRE